MKREDAIAAANRASSAAGQLKAPLSVTYKTAVNVMAQFCEEASASAPAEALYRFASSGIKKPVEWRDVGADTRVAFEVFRATYLALLVLVKDAEAAAAEVQRSQASRGTRRFGKRIFDDKVPGMRDRVSLGQKRRQQVKETDSFIREAAAVIAGSQSAAASKAVAKKK